MIRIFFTIFILSGASWAAPAEAVAKKSLNTLLQAYAEGNITEAENSIDPAMLGHQQLVESMRVSSSAQKQIKIHLKDTRLTTAKDIVVIRTGWEKRYLNPQGTAPQVISGKTLFLMQLIKKEWKLSSQSGDNIFAM